MKWTTYFIVVFGSFMIFIITLVVKTYSVNTELVSDDYYSQELAYQKTIEEAEQAKESSNKITIRQKNDALIVSFSDTTFRADHGMIEFYRPSDASRDKTVTLQTGKNGVQVIPSNVFVTGLYKVKFRWSAEGKMFYKEEDLYIQ